MLQVFCDYNNGITVGKIKRYLQSYKTVFVIESSPLCDDPLLKICIRSKNSALKRVNIKNILPIFHEYNRSKFWKSMQTENNKYTIIIFHIIL